MTVVEMQACLGRLYVDDMFRDLFFRDSEIALRWYKLSDTELASLACIDRKMLEYFAETLKTKRRKRLKAAYPGLFSLDEREIQMYYLRYYQLYTMHEARSAFSDILQFGKFMEESLASSESLPPYAAEIARFERLQNSVRLAPIPTNQETREVNAAANTSFTLESRLKLNREVQVSNFYFDVVTILEKLLAKAEIVETVAASEVYGLVFQRAGSTQMQNILRLNRPVMMLLEICDGHYTVKEIIMKSESILGVGGLEADIVSTLERLLKLKILSI